MWAATYLVKQAGLARLTRMMASSGVNQDVIKGQMARQMHNLLSRPGTGNNVLRILEASPKKLNRGEHRLSMLPGYVHEKILSSPVEAGGTLSPRAIYAQGVEQGFRAPSKALKAVYSND